MLEQYDAVLLIGDRAITTYYGLLSIIPESVHQVPNQIEGIRITDLSMKWFERTRLPFVFGVWATRHNAPPPLKLSAGCGPLVRWAWATWPLWPAPRPSAWACPSG